MKPYFPPIDILLELEPEEIGQYLLAYLNSLVKEKAQNKLNRYNITIGSNSHLTEYAGEHAPRVGKLISTAWIWLLREGILAPLPDEQGIDWCFITPRGEQINSKNDFIRFSHIGLLPKSVLDPKLAQKVWPIFIRGNFDTAVFAAFKEVEVRMREATNLDSSFIGIDLARKAFDPDSGKLTDMKNPVGGEREAYAHLFAGTLGVFKNPASHRDVDYDDPIVATSLVLFANTLLKLINKRSEEYEKEKVVNEKLQASSP